MSALSSSPIIPEMDFAPGKSKVFLITKNGMMPFVPKVFTMAPANWHLYSNYLQHCPSARVEDQSFAFSCDVSARNNITSLGLEAIPDLSIRSPFPTPLHPTPLSHQQPGFWTAAGAHPKVDSKTSLCVLQSAMLLIKLFQNKYTDTYKVSWSWPQVNRQCIHCFAIPGRHRHFLRQGKVCPGICQAGTFSPPTDSWCSFLQLKNITQV